MPHPHQGGGTAGKDPKLQEGHVQPLAPAKMRSMEYTSAYYLDHLDQLPVPAPLQRGYRRSPRPTHRMPC